MKRKTHREKIYELHERTMPKFHFERWFSAKLARTTIPEDKEHLTTKEALELRIIKKTLMEAFYEGYLIGKEHRRD
jgi:hypothetical protein